MMPTRRDLPTRVSTPGAFCASAMLVLVGACGADSNSGQTGDDTAVAPFADVDDSGDDVIAFDAGDTGETDTTEPDTGGAGEGCDSAEDCETGEICVDLLAGPSNGFCTTRCLDDSQCPEGYDCVVIGDDELSFQACVDVDFCLDEDEDGFGLGPGCTGPDCDDSEPAINPAANEVCNGTDDDCDDIVDNNPVEAGDDCDTGFFGVCSEGRVTCSSGLTECVARTTASDEICDGRDNDCDGSVDEEPTDAVAWYRDIDSDRFGNPDDVLVACTRPDGYVADAGDCDDRDGDVSPAATEVCDGYDNDCDDVVDGDEAVGTQTWYADTDRDSYGDPDVSRFGCPESGWVIDNRDCDDEDGDIHPGADEVCDGYDNDCDESIDEGAGTGATEWYADTDEDGYGDPDDSVLSCLEVDGRVDNDDDCDDRDREINPDAVEVCDDRDNDCDDAVDEGVASLWYRDSDRDGFGDPDVTRYACSKPTGWVANEDDCDDATGARFPGNPEICDTLDNDCNGIPDDGVGTTWYLDGDGDGYGDTAVVACTRPPGTVPDGGDCNDANRDVNPDADELCSTTYDDNCDGAINDASSADAGWWFWDEDGDGQGQELPLIARFPPIALLACTQPPDLCLFPVLCLFDPDLVISYVDNDNDCDDSTARAYLGGGPEECDGYDNDCDGTRDEGFTRDETYCRDRDGDTYGSPSSEITVCTRPVDASAGAWVVDCTDRDDDDEFYH